jgi:hypothetical protein
MKFLQKKRIVLAALLITVIFGLAQAKIAYAVGPVGWAAIAGLGAIFTGVAGDVINGITSTAIYYIGYALAYFLGFFSSAVFYLGGFLVDFALKINSFLLESPVIKAGWGIVLNFANLGFVLAIIIIAFATIFRLQGYQMKQILWKLIVAALLVNFSLVIAGAFISVSDIITKSFNDKIKGETGLLVLSEKLAKILDVQAMLSLKDFKELKKLNNNSSQQGTVVEEQTSKVLPNTNPDKSAL